MRSKRALIILPLSLLLVILMAITSFAEPKPKIVGTWVSQENPDYKLEFSKNGICKYYYVGKEYRKCGYQISSSYDRINNDRTLFIEMSDENGETLDFYKLKNTEEANNILVLGDEEKGEAHFYDRVY